MKGLRLPVGVGSKGGASLVEGDIQNNKIISIALGSGENENAFQQDLALGISMVFDINDPRLRAKILIRLYSIFNEFSVQKRFKLLKNTIMWRENNDKQELELEFKYVNLESDDEVEFRKSFTASD